MTGFNRLTIVAAVEVVAGFNSHDDMNVFEVQWDIEQYVSTSSKSARIASWSKVATSVDPMVMTEAGKMKLSRAIVELAVQAPGSKKGEPSWRRFLAGLRFDGFEVVTDRVLDPSGRQSIFDDGPREIEVAVLRRMLPDDLPGMDFREADSEVDSLLQKHLLTVAAGHLEQATSAFQRGEWAAANGQLRTFYQDLLDRIAVKLGFDEARSDDAKRAYLASDSSGPFLLAQYNEWENDRGKPAFVLGLWARLHPEGSHPGLSEEDDCTFRLQVTLITARLFLRRLDQRISAQ
jgi:hypothetical protein